MKAPRIRVQPETHAEDNSVHVTAVSVERRPLSLPTTGATFQLSLHCLGPTVVSSQKYIKKNFDDLSGFLPPIDREVPLPRGTFTLENPFAGENTRFRSISVVIGRSEAITPRMHLQTFLRL